MSLRRPRRLHHSPWPTNIFLTIITKHAKVNKQKGTEFLQSSAGYPRCVTHMQEMKKIIINTSYTWWSPDAITSLLRRDVLSLVTNISRLEMFVTKVTRGGGFLLGIVRGRGLRLYVKKDEAHTHTHTQPKIHSLTVLPMLVYVVHGLFCIYNGPWTCRHTPRHNLKHRTFLFDDIAEISTVSVLSSNQNQAYIGCRFETLKYWPE